jgi:hypothetical protein
VPAWRREQLYKGVERTERSVSRTTEIGHRCLESMVRHKGAGARLVGVELRSYSWLVDPDGGTPRAEMSCGVWPGFKVGTRWNRILVDFLARIQRRGPPLNVEMLRWRDG